MGYNSLPSPNRRLIGLALLGCNYRTKGKSVMHDYIAFYFSPTILYLYRDRSPRDRKWDYKDKNRDKDVSIWYELFFKCSLLNRNRASYTTIQYLLKINTQGSGNSSTCNDWTEHKSSSGKKYYYNRFDIFCGNMNYLDQNNFIAAKLKSVSGKNQENG